MRRRIPGLAPVLVLSTLLAAAGAGRAAAQGRAAAPDSAPRPRPYPVLETPAFAAAVQRGTRTRTGVPGPKYWTNYARYRIDASLDPATRMLSGRETIRYENRSPDTLAVLALHVRQDLFRAGATRNREVPITGGMRLARVAAQGAELKEAPAPADVPAWWRDGTVLWLRPPRPVPPGGSIDLELEWSFTVTPDGAPRGGTDGEVFMVSYWYPQMAVYDDLGGWQADPYEGNAEFYMGYADYDVALTVPAGWLVGATGTLQNPEQVLSERTRRRLAEAARTRNVVHVVAAGERGAGKATTAGEAGRLTWRFHAANVRDFDFAASDQYLWDATTAVVGDADGDGRADSASINTLYRPSRIPWAWDRSARYLQHSVEFLSRYLWPYRYPRMTAIDGVRSCSGMEYPMLTCIGGPRDTLSLYSVIVHETGHMWFPMQVGSNETRHGWQDEGLTRFNQTQAMREFFHGYELSAVARQAYGALARRGGEVELMRHADEYPIGSPAYAVASYEKMSLILRALEAVLGDSTFLKAYREYGRRWLEKHPTPFDFWNTLEDVAGRDLDWFWRPWFYDTWTLDQAVAAVEPVGDSTAITIEDRGLAPMPVFLAVTTADGATRRLTLPVEPWLAGARRQTVRVPGTARAVAIDPDAWLPDVDRDNNVWGGGR